MLPSGPSTDYALGWMLERVELGGTRTQVIGHASRTIEGASVSFLMSPNVASSSPSTSNVSFADMKTVGVAKVFTERAK